ncbi:MAG: tRNA (N(6)-L-threonylcarbamoyladenosine(37)-C(2))-methylthiotransferase MtaB [Holosporaceae bacterium]|jgi:threonylcarbamoyladenosine tRNA methylthiotransferase MtaB|nr:tRNA (N(6)-L-threonylcarbamoyladenosine(37)-C(2))-methylthiotransferase MtaB [Holosporaceae bacterium]
MSALPGRVVNFGCRLNTCESERIGDFIRELGLNNVVLINTCAVTAEAERKLCQTIRRLHVENPEAKIVLTGCASELHPERYMQMDGVVGIVSNKTKLSKSEYVKYTEETSLWASTAASAFVCRKVRGFLQIQNGCDQKCTYCVVRLTRGNNVSLSEDDIVNQARFLLDRGHRDIILTGVNISAYGRDRDPRQNLAFLIRYLLRNVPELTRLGLSSLDPADMDDDLLKLIESEERLLPHIHESLQSGDNLILKRMGRRHTRSQVIEINERILRARPEVIFGADIIVGFPTESDDMFNHTKYLISEATISRLHIFPFSPRPGTPASSMPMVEKQTVRCRVKEMQALSSEVLGKKLMEQIGKDIIILAEDQANGKTNSFLPVWSSSVMVAGHEYLFRCDRTDGRVIIGRPIAERRRDGIF